MAEFCPGCPFGGDCKGEIDEIRTTEVVAETFFHTRYTVGKFAVAFADGEPSNPMPSNSRTMPTSELETRIDECPKPIKSWPLERRPSICGALKDGDFYDSTLASHVLSKEQLVQQILHEQTAK